MVLVAPAWAEGSHGTREEAKAMAEKAAALVKENPQKAFAKFQEKDGGFIDRDLYVFVLDGNGVFSAHGTKPVLVGKPGINMKDANGFEFMKAFVAVKDTGWVDYRWPDPTDENKVKDKSSYIVKVGDYAIGVGHYKE
ncbi:MAG: cache domain-containing protein [Alphaproteobacteria bacterium]|nr:cache domain-containing protein [Alphaproteobacteria bacterium]